MSREFHAHGGWYFSREENGLVRVRTPLGSIVLDAPTWASIVAHVAGGDDARRFMLATALHSGEDMTTKSEFVEGMRAIVSEWKPD